MFAPGHPASRKVVKKYLHGKQDMSVDPGEGSPFRQTLEKLEEEVKGREFRFILPDEGISSF